MAAVDQAQRELTVDQGQRMDRQQRAFPGDGERLPLVGPGRTPDGGRRSPGIVPQVPRPSTLGPFCRPTIRATAGRPARRRFTPAR